MNHKGFTLIETLVSLSIVMVILTTFLPINTLLLQHQKDLSNKRIISSLLHDELQKVIYTKRKIPSKPKRKELEGIEVTIEFMAENKLIKGCARWDNIKNEREKVCLFGYK